MEPFCIQWGGGVYQMFVDKGAFMRGAAQSCCKLRTNFVQNRVYFVLYMRGKVRESVANQKINLRQFHAITVPLFQCPFSEFPSLSVAVNDHFE